MTGWCSSTSAESDLVPVTRFGNVPINAKIKVWAVTNAPPDHEAILRRWETFNNVRTGSALVAFILLLVLVSAYRRDRS